MADNAFVRIGQLVADIVDQLLQFRRFRRFINFDKILPRIVCTAGPGQKVRVKEGIFGRIGAGAAAAPTVR